MSMIIRRAVLADLPAIVGILNHGIKTRHSVGFFASQSPDGMRDWFEEHLTDPRYPVMVAEGNAQMVGWISLSPYRKGREAFDRTGEISAYIHEDYQRKGICQMLLDHILQFAAGTGFKIIFAIVLDKNDPSIRLLEKNNFERWAFLPEVAEIDSILLNHIYLGKKISRRL